MENSTKPPQLRDQLWEIPKHCQYLLAQLKAKVDLTSPDHLVINRAEFDTAKMLQYRIFELQAPYLGISAALKAEVIEADEVVDIQVNIERDTLQLDTIRIELEQLLGHPINYAQLR